MSAWLGRESCTMCQHGVVGVDDGSVSLCGWCASIVVVEALAGKGASEVLSGARPVPAPVRLVVRRTRDVPCDVCGETICVVLAPSLAACPRCVQRALALGDEE